MSGVKVVDRRVAVTRALGSTLGRALDRAADAGAAYYRANVPVRTGRLRRSARRLTGAGRFARAWGSDRSAPYSKYVELGTDRMRARPRLRESHELATKILVQELKNV